MRWMAGSLSRSPAAAVFSRSRFRGKHDDWENFRGGFGRARLQSADGGAVFREAGWRRSPSGGCEEPHRGLGDYVRWGRGVRDEGERDERSVLSGGDPGGI